MSADSLLEAFLEFTERRGIPPRFRAVYEAEVHRILAQCGVRAIDDLDSTQLASCVRDAEARLQNTRATCVALDAFLREQLSVDMTIADEATSHDPELIVQPHDASEHRRFVRVPFRQEVFMEGNAAKNRASDLSEGGMYLETTQYLEVGDLIKLSFPLRAGEPFIEVRARVVYCDPGVGAGVDFVDIKPGQRMSIRQYIRELVA